MRIKNWHDDDDYFNFEMRFQNLFRKLSTSGGENEENTFRNLFQHMGMAVSLIMHYETKINYFHSIPR